MRVVKPSQMEKDYVKPAKRKALETYAQALVLMRENAGDYVELHRGRLSSDEHRAMWDVLMAYHNVYDWEARYPEVGVCALYARVPEPIRSKVKKWFKG